MQKQLTADDEINPVLFPEKGVLMKPGLKQFALAAVFFCFRFCCSEIYGCEDKYATGFKTIP